MAVYQVSTNKVYRIQKGKSAIESRTEPNEYIDINFTKIKLNQQEIADTQVEAQFSLVFWLNIWFFIQIPAMQIQNRIQTQIKLQSLSISHIQHTKQIKENSQEHKGAGKQWATHAYTHINTLHNRDTEGEAQSKDSAGKDHYIYMII